MFVDIAEHTFHCPFSYIVNGTNSRPFLSKHPNTALQPVKIDFGRDRSRVADENGIEEPQRNSNKLPRTLGNSGTEMGTESLLISESEIQHILDENWMDDDEDASPSVLRQKKRKRSPVESSEPLGDKRDKAILIADDDTNSDGGEDFM